MRNSTTLHHKVMLIRYDFQSKAKIVCARAGNTEAVRSFASPQNATKTKLKAAKRQWACAWMRTCVEAKIAAARAVHTQKSKASSNE